MKNRLFLLLILASTGTLLGQNSPSTKKMASINVEECPAPAGLLAHGTRNNIAMNWSLPIDHQHAEKPVNLIEIRYTDVEGYAITNRVESSTSSYTLADLPCNTLYTIEIRSYCISNTSAWQKLTQSTRPCLDKACKTVASATAVPTAEAIKLIWKPSSTSLPLENTSIRYRIEGSEEAWAYLSSTDKEMLLPVAGLTVGAVYEYQVSTDCREVEKETVKKSSSAWSKEQTFTVK